MAPCPEHKLTNPKYPMVQHVNTSEENEAIVSEVMELLSIRRNLDVNGGEMNQGEEKIITNDEMIWICPYLNSREKINRLHRSPFYLEWEKNKHMLRAKHDAESALIHYNRQNGTDFELHEVAKSCSSGFMCPAGVPVTYCHMNFLAKSRDSETFGMFFAELECECFSRSVKVCCLLDPVTGMKTGCKFCGHDVHHPTNVVLCVTELQI